MSFFFSWMVLLLSSLSWFLKKLPKKQLCCNTNGGFFVSWLITLHMTNLWRMVLDVSPDGRTETMEPTVSRSYFLLLYHFIVSLVDLYSILYLAIPRYSISPRLGAKTAAPPSGPFGCHWNLYLGPLGRKQEPDEPPRKRLWYSRWLIIFCPSGAAWGFFAPVRLS